MGNMEFGKHHSETLLVTNKQKKVKLGTKYSITLNN